MVPRMVEFIKRWELYMQNAYKDKDGSWHVGFGHGNAAGVLPFVDEFTVLKDEAEALAILEADLQYLVPIIEKMLKVEVNDNEFCALWDVAYNRGPGTLRNSAIIYWLNQPEVKNYRKLAANAFVHYYEGPEYPVFTKLDTSTDVVTQQQRVYLGLQLRRIDDASLFLLPPV